MRVLVTGAAGFIGKWAVTELSKKGHEVIGTDKLEAPNVVTTDITEMNQVAQLFDKIKPEAVVHLAAISGSTGKNEAEQSLRQPHLNFAVNALGAANICEACRLKGVQSLVYMSSLAVYGRTGPDRLPITESTQISLEHAYATSKYLGELVAQTYASDFGIKVAIFRTPFIVGEGQKERNLLKEFIEAGVANQELLLFGRGAHKRDFIHASDLIDAFSRALVMLNSGHIRNELFVLGNAPMTVYDLAQLVVRVAGRGRVRPGIDSDRTFDQFTDFSKAKEVLGWEPKVSVEEGIRRILAADYGP